MSHILCPALTISFLAFLKRMVLYESVLMAHNKEVYRMIYKRGVTAAVNVRLLEFFAGAGGTQ